MPSSTEIREILSKIEEIKPLPLAVTKLFEITNNIESSVREATNILSSDQALSAKVLKAANSPVYGYSQRIATVTQAIVILGFSGLRQLVVSVAMKDAAVGGGSPERKELWQHALVTACISKQVTNLLPTKDPEMAFISGLLHDIGKIIFLDHYPMEYQQLQEESEKTTTPMNKLELSNFKMNHADIGRELCKHWQLPAVLIRPVAYHHMNLPETSGENVDDQIIRTVQIGNELSKFAASSSATSPIVNTSFLSHFKKEGFWLKTYKDILNGLPDEIQKVAEVFGSGEEIKQGFQSAEAPVKYSIDIKDEKMKDIFKLLMHIKGHNYIPAENVEFQETTAYLFADFPKEYKGDVKVGNFSTFSGRSENVNGPYINIRNLSNWIDNVIQS